MVVHRRHTSAGAEIELKWLDYERASRTPVRTQGSERRVLKEDTHGPFEFLRRAANERNGRELNAAGRVQHECDRDARAFPTRSCARWIVRATRRVERLQSHVQRIDSDCRRVDITAE